MKTSEAVASQIESLLQAPQMAGMRSHVVSFMESFGVQENIETLTSSLMIVEPEARFDVLNHVMLSRIPEGFPKNNLLLWHGIANVILNSLALTHSHPISDTKIAQIRQDYSKGKNPYKLIIN